MDRIIKQITDYFVSQLPEGKDYYRIEELGKYGFPDFLIRRIHIELQWNLDESMVLPQTDWANTQSEAVQKAWQQFLNAIHAEVKLPASYTKAVVETAVADIIEMLVEPRQHITDILFGGEQELTASELSERLDLLVVYPHFPRVLTGYMDRKKKDVLTRKNCKKIISRVDEKVTDKYTPLQWAQMLDPLFKLMHLGVDTDLMRLFFLDRGSDNLAERFDQTDSSVTRAEFIEVLTSPELVNYDDYEESLSKKRGKDKPDSQTQEAEKPSLVPGEEAQEDEVTEDDEMIFKEKEAKNKELIESGATEQENNTDAVSHPEERGGLEQNIESEPKERKKNNLLKKEVEEHRESTSLNDFFADNELQERENNEMPSQPVFEFSAKETPKENEEQESPIWMRFVDSDRDAEEPDEADFTERNPINIREDRPAEEEKIELLDMLADEKNYFINELFDGSKEHYQQSVFEISQKNSWREASTLIRQNIFERNNINIYAEAAVDFTDRLQRYFLDNDNSNQ